MPDPTLPLPTEPIPPHGQQNVPPPADPYGPPTPAPQALPPIPVSPPQHALVPVSAPVPVTVPVPGPPPPIICRIGEIAVTSATIYTPTAEMPLRRSQWVMTEQWQVHTKIPTWAILMCIFTFFCIPFFNFLFLLAKDTYYTGHALVSVSNVGRHYVARIPVNNQAQVANLQNQVNYVRSLAAR